MMEIKGAKGATGYAVGKAVILKKQEYKAECKKIVDPREEIQKLENARESYKRELKELYEKAKADAGADSAAVFQAYEEMVKDDIFFQKSIRRVEEELVNMEFALEEEKKSMVAVFTAMEDPYMKERGTDIENVCNALIRRMKGIESPAEKLRKIREDFIPVAEDLTPADTIRLDKKFLKGFVTERGGSTSHTVILAKTLGIPAVIGASHITEDARDGETICIDGETGTIILKPEEEILQQYEKEKQKEKRKRELLDKGKDKLAVTTDGRRIDVSVNFGEIESVRAQDMKFCDGVGLFRTEFIYMAQEDYPTEEFQYEVYRELAERAGEKEVIIRTLDIGGDKQADYMELPREQNPFLGYRAVRICLDRTEMFKTQLRAILRASAYGKVSVMFPMIVNLEELRKAKALVKECKQELDEKKLSYDRNIRVGIMVETPAAVLLSDKLAKEADFFSIGTNDLIQYMTAADRMNEHIQYLYRSCNLSVLRAIKTVAANAHKAGIRVGICGEAASDERMTGLWLGLGIDELSMVPSQVPCIKNRIRHTSQREAEKIVQKVLEMDTVDEAERYLEERMANGV